MSSHVFPLFLALLTPIMVQGAASLPIPKFRAVSIDTNIQIGYGLALADVDGDKKTDILLADKNQIVWYQNPSWKKHLIAERLTEKDHVCLAARDIDGDGKAEIAVGANWNPGDTINSGSVHYLIAPPDRTQRWEPVTLPHEPTVHRMRWVKNARGKFELVVVPLHGRGNHGGKGEGVKILAYSLPSNPKGKWETRVLDASLHLTHNFDSGQWDGDDAEEVVVAGKEGLFLWNDGASTLRALTSKMVDATNTVGAGEVRAGRLPGGKRYLATVEPMHGNQVCVYLEGKTPGDLWTRQVIDEHIVDGHAVACADFLKTGADQFAVGWRAMGKPGSKVGVKLFFPEDSSGIKWNQVLIDDNTMACEDLVSGDLDGDGKIDLVAAGRATKNVKIYFNETGP